MNMWKFKYECFFGSNASSESRRLVRTKYEHIYWHYNILHTYKLSSRTYFETSVAQTQDEVPLLPAAGGLETHARIIRAVAGNEQLQKIS